METKGCPAVQSQPVNQEMQMLGLIWIVKS